MHQTDRLVSQPAQEFWKASCGLDITQDLNTLTPQCFLLDTCFSLLNTRSSTLLLNTCSLILNTLFLFSICFSFRMAPMKRQQNLVTPSPRRNIREEGLRRHSPPRWHASNNLHCVLRFYPHFSTFLTHVTSRALSFPRHLPRAPSMCLQITGFIFAYIALTCIILFAHVLIWFLTAVPRLLITFLWLARLWLTRPLLVLYTFPI